MPREDSAIVFSHANGFPAGTYRLLFEHWRAAGVEVHALAQFGHAAEHPVTSGWPHLADELLRFAERALPAGRPAWFVGHSLGGFLSLLAALREPRRVRGVVLLDSPVLDGWKAQAVWAAKASGFVARYPLSVAARRRRELWPSSDAALAHFAGKAAFARWHPEVLRDYIASGTQPHEGGQRRLGFRREVEAAIYDSLPHHIGGLLRRTPLACPVGFVGGRASLEVRRVGLGPTRRIVQSHLRWIDGSHLFPMERPHETAAQVLDLIDAMAHEPARHAPAPAESRR